MDSQNKGWVLAINYTPVSAETINILLAMVVYHAYGLRQDAVQHHIGRGETSVEAQMTAPSVFQGVQQAVNQFITLTQYGGHPMPLDRILH